MAIFLTGGSGFIGSHVLRQLEEQGEEVYALVRSGKLEHFKPTGRGKVHIVQADLTDSSTYEKALSECQQVIHIAGLISTRKEDAEKTRRANLATTEALWQACEKAGCEKIVYLASIFAHGWGKGEQPAVEDTAYDQKIYQLPNPYFKSKRDAEMLTWGYAEKLPIVFAYPGFCIGPGDYRLSSMRPVAEFLKGQLPAYINGGMNFIDVRDAATGLINSLEGSAGQKYLLGDHNLRWQQFFELLAKITGKAAPKIQLNYNLALFSGKLLESFWSKSPLNEADVTVMGNIWYYDSTKARSEIDLPSRPLEKSLRDGITWLQTENMV